MRNDNWQDNLSALIQEKRQEPFNFTNHNCLLWAFDCVKAVNDLDLSLPYRDNFTDEKSAALLLRRTDKVKTSQELLVKKLGELRPISFARPGDIVFVNPKSAGIELPTDFKLFGPVPGVCYGQTSYFVGELGLVQAETLLLGETIWVS